MRNYFYFIFLLAAFACNSNNATQETGKDTLAAVRDSMGPAMAATAVAENYLDTLIGKWVEVGKGDSGRYIHTIHQDFPERFIKVEKKGEEYLLTANNLDLDMPGPDVYKMDSATRVFAGIILNTYEYVVNIKNIKDGKEYKLTFTPLHQSMQDAIRISGFFPPESHQYFINDRYPDKYILKDESDIEYD